MGVDIRVTDVVVRPVATRVHTTGLEEQRAGGEGSTKVSEPRPPILTALHVVQTLELPVADLEHERREDRDGAHLQPGVDAHRVPVLDRAQLGAARRRSNDAGALTHGQTTTDLSRRTAGGAVC